MVSAKHDRKGFTGVDVRDPFADLIERLIDVTGNGKHIAHIADGNGLPQIHAGFETIGSIESRDFANALGAESCAGPIGCAAIERRSKNGHVVLAALPYVFNVGSFGKRVNPGEVGKFSSAERRSPAILNGSGSGQTEFKTMGYLFFMLRSRHERLCFDGVFCLRTIVVMKWNLASVFTLFGQDVASVMPAVSWR